MRTAKPWFRTSKNAWFVEIDGRQIRLAKGEDNEKAAYEAYYLIMADKPGQIAAPANLKVSDLAGHFLDYSQKHHVADTYANYRHFLLEFCKDHGKLAVTDIRPIHLTRWLDKHPTWNGARRHAVMAVKRAYSWGKQQGLLTANPIEDAQQDPVNRRERVLTQAESKEILGAVKDTEFKEFLTAMFETGCRPSEVARVTASNVDLERGIWTFTKHKTGKKTGKSRIVYLTPVMEEMTRRLMALRPEGPLFLNRRKKAFTRNAIRCRFLRLRARLPHIPHFVAYHVRHTFATNALVNGVGVAQVAALLGHTSTQMVDSTYSHLAKQLSHMREAARQATGA